VHVVTWNVNSLKARLPRVLGLLEDLGPDLLLLQETKLAAEAFPHLDVQAAGYTAVEHGTGRWNGVAVLVRRDWEVGSVTRGLADGDEARWVELEVAPPDAAPSLRVVSAYVPNGRMVASEHYAAKLAFLGAVGRRVQELRGDGRLLVGGDFNVALTDADVYDPAAFVGSTHVTPEERAGVTAMGLEDLFRRCRGDEPGFTWWDYRAGHFHKGLGMRIDLLLATPDLAAGVRDCRVLRDYRKGPKPSDHAPLLAELDV
jgi:exodeoxyribonuclease III